MAFGLKMLLTVGSLVLVGVILRVTLPHFSGWTFRAGAKCSSYHTTGLRFGLVLLQPF